MIDINLARQGGIVTIGLMDGRMQNRCIVKFSPYLSMLAVDAQGQKALRESAAETLIPVENIAYIAFLKKPGEKFPRPVGIKPCRVHVAGGKSFQVEAALPAHKSPTDKDPQGGFFAYPQNLESPYREFFFYERGVNATEGKEPIGQMLVDGGHARKEDVRIGISVQNPPIGQILVEQERVAPEAIDAAVAVQDRKRLRLGEVLIEAGLATQKDIEHALSEQKNRKGKKIGEILIELGLVKEQDLSHTLAKKFNLPCVDLSTYRINPMAAGEVPKDLIERYGFLPVQTDDRTLTVAISDPLYTEINDVLRFHLKKKRILEVLVTPSQLKKFVAAYLKSMIEVAAGDENSMDHLLKEMSDEAGLAGVDSEAEENHKPVNDSDSSIIKLANQIIIDAFRRGASDIHIEPNGNERATTVRFRIDGDCVAYQDIPPPFRVPLVSRLKIMADLDISEKRKPQDGKIRFRLRDRKIELRIATIPTVNSNEDIVMRILAASKPIPLDKMGMSERNLRELKKIITRPYGLILCVGPTGSGKTTTLHSVLGHINTVDMKIWTAEDPVEITQAGLRQVQVQAKIGFTFAAAMRAFLRADPDVIMVGEMRDEETAGTAVEASLTGHLVLSTLHTNTAPETVTRLLDMGLDPFSFADALLGTLAQRLARGLCGQCKEQYVASVEETEEIILSYGEEALEKNLGIQRGRELSLWRGKGCEICANTGLKGRVGLHELLIVDDVVKREIQRKGPVEEIRKAAIATGMTTLLQDGVAKCIAGATEMRQVLAVCSK